MTWAASGSEACGCIPAVREAGRFSTNKTDESNADPAVGQRLRRSPTTGPALEHNVRHAICTEIKFKLAIRKPVRLVQH